MGCLAKSVEEVEGGTHDGTCTSVGEVAPRKSVSHRVKAARLVLDGELKPQKLANPMMLGYGHQALVEEELEAVVVCLDDEGASP